MNSRNASTSRGSEEISLTDLLNFGRKWKQYKSDFKKKYKDEEEESFRKQIYFKRYTFMQENNKKYLKNLSSFRVQPTHLSDMTEEEIQNYYKENDKHHLSNEEEWENYKRKKKKNFCTESQEDILKYFFLTKLSEAKEFQLSMQAIGLAVDQKDIDHFCDFTDDANLKTLFDSACTTKKKAIDKEKMKRQRAYSQSLSLDSRMSEIAEEIEKRGEEIKREEGNKN